MNVYTSHFPLTARVKGFKDGLLPFHSRLLRESLLFSFPPLNYMLKSSGSSCLISDPRFENLEVCWGGCPGRSAACSPRASSVGRLAANISLQSCYANRALLVEGARRGRSATLGATSGKDDAHSSRRHTRGAPGGLTRALKQACSCASRSAICVQHFDDSLSSAFVSTASSASSISSSSANLADNID
jgi:hypothetical protein